MNAWRMGKAALQVQAVSLSYNIKSQQLSGTLECINEDRLLPPPETVWERNQKKRLAHLAERKMAKELGFEANDDDEDAGSDSRGEESDNEHLATAA